MSEKLEKQISSGGKAFYRYAVFTVVYNVIVILWGVFLRASHSGDGCGQHWLTCQGEAIPSAPELKTVIEFSHRITTALAGIVVIVLVIWAFQAFKKGSIVRKLSVLSLIFIIIEGAIGGGLVLTGNTAGNWTPTRPYWTAGHLINTFILVGFLTLTAWYAGGREYVKVNSGKLRWLLILGVAAIFITGISGSMAALTNMLFPSDTIAEGIAKDFDPDSHILLRLRIIHPILSVLLSVFLIFIAGWVRKFAEGNAAVVRWSNALSILIIFQVVFGAATLLMLAPIVMQLGHLLLADLVWIAFIVMFAAVYSTEDDAGMTRA
ncbi:MAG: heme A synthase [Acidobacteria bacterium]|nr:heme A synthase [Acidobacteriota bacterium]